ncbi:MAG: alpha/beta fold hydrolase [Planctomycetota bacterium]|nr:alpha/beta fold hydrolase [Planctomycetota bacterium]
MRIESPVECGGIVRGITRLAAADGRTLWAAIHRPRGRVAGGAVLVPGWSGPRAGPAGILAGIADRLARDISLLCVRFDLRGRGDSEGVFGETDLDMMIEDALAACRLAMDAAGTDEIAAVGLCSGGNVALGAATLLPRITRVAALSTYPFQPSRGRDVDAARRWRNVKAYAVRIFRAETWRKLFRGEIDFGRIRKNIAASDRERTGGRNLKDSRRDIGKALANYRGSCLFVYGGADEEGTRARSSFREFASRSGLDASFHVVAGANHNFYRAAWREELIAVLERFLGTRETGEAAREEIRQNGGRLRG